MLDEHRENHLSRISTIWTMVREAHGDETKLINAAQVRMIDRYSGAVYRYLVAVLRDRDAADEVFQEFALKLTKGGFRNADRSRGRFRDYVKVSVLRLVKDHHRRRQRQDSLRGGGQSDDVEVADDAEPNDQRMEESFLTSCREELLGRTWQSMKSLEQQSGQLLFTVLSYRSNHPEKRSQQMADELNDRLQPDKPLTAAGIRKTLERARVQFADRLLDEVIETLDSSDPNEIEQELIDLSLHAYCSHAWQRRYEKRD